MGRGALQHGRGLSTLVVALTACGTAGGPVPVGEGGVPTDTGAPLGDVLRADGAPPAPSDAAPQDVPAARVAVEIGTGLRAWEAIPPAGGRLELVHGPQGGYHLLGRVRFRGIVPDVRLTFRVTPAEGGPSLTLEESVRRMEDHGLARDGDGYVSAWPELVILDIRFPGTVVGRMFLFQVFVRDNAAGAVYGASRRITVVDEEP